MRRRDEIVQMYLQYADQANNWDLVDMSAPKILGHWLMLPSGLGGHDYKQRLLDELADSTNLWRQRISMVCTWKTMQMGDHEWCLRYARKHLHHPHDLMHKAVGWMLREVGKRGNQVLLEAFLEKHVDSMPRTTLRYAIELLPDKHIWMGRPTLTLPTEGGKRATLT